MKIKISKKYQDVTVFDQYEMVINEGQINVLLGPSGCGKTTLLQAMAKLTDYEGHIPPINQVSYVFQEDRLFPYLTVYKNLSIICDDQDQIHRMLEKLDVLDLKDKYPNQLSGGEKQRISIIRAFIHPSNLILMDEPFKSLDYDLKQTLIKEILTIQQETKKTIVLVTHDLDIALYLGHMINVLSRKITTLLWSYQNDFQSFTLTPESVNVRNKITQLLAKEFSEN